MISPQSLLFVAQDLQSQAKIHPDVEQEFLRRSGSSAYYALFHYIASRAFSYLFSNGLTPAQHHLVLRQFTHTQIHATAKGFRSGWPGLKPKIKNSISDQSFPPELLVICEVFSDLSELRNDCDYNHSRILYEHDIGTAIHKVEEVLTTPDSVWEFEVSKWFLFQAFLKEAQRD